MCNIISQWLHFLNSKIQAKNNITGKNAAGNKYRTIKNLQTKCTIRDKLHKWAFQIGDWGLGIGDLGLGNRLE